MGQFDSIGYFTGVVVFTKLGLERLNSIFCKPIPWLQMALGFFVVDYCRVPHHFICWLDGLSLYEAQERGIKSAAKTATFFIIAHETGNS
jgi:hypothetical protein